MFFQDCIKAQCAGSFREKIPGKNHGKIMVSCGCSLQSTRYNILYPLVMTNIAMGNPEMAHRKRWFTYKKWWIFPWQTVQ
jgi:hypothetical protein